MLNIFGINQKLENKQTKFLMHFSYNKWNWTIGKGVYLDEIDKLVKIKEEEYNQKFQTTLQISSLTIMLIFYSIFIYKMPQY